LSVAKYMGDGVLIYFGYPQAHEDDAERAVRAGLAVIEAVCQLPARQDLNVRLGIATGSPLASLSGVLMAACSCGTVLAIGSPRTGASPTITRNKTIQDQA
jgi:hypothetical protein